MTELERDQVIGLVFGVLGVFAWVATLVSYRKTRRLLSTVQRAEGTVIRLEPGAAGEFGPTYAPVFTFKDASGVAHEVTASLHTDKPAYQVGQKVRVLYSSENPANASIDKFWELWAGPAAGGLVGTVFLIVWAIFVFLQPGVE